MQLSKHFTLEEATFSYTATREGLRNNIIDPDHLDNIKFTADRMEEVRTLLWHHHIRVLSWYRTQAVNQIVGGSLTSAHMKGYAIDFICPKFGSPLECIKEIYSKIIYDQIILEFDRWVHISFDPQNRLEILQIKNRFNGYKKLNLT